MVEALGQDCAEASGLDDSIARSANHPLIRGPGGAGASAALGVGGSNEVMHERGQHGRRVIGLDFGGPEAPPVGTPLAATLLAAGTTNEADPPPEGGTTNDAPP